jgi:LacI family transcriptional regulator
LIVMITWRLYSITPIAARRTRESTVVKISQTTSRRHHARVTISDVAVRAGVSPMTVSRVINSEDSVRNSTRAAVDAAIHELCYSPNRAARSLASGRQIQVCLLYANPSSTYLSATLLGALEQTRENDTQLVVAECDCEADAERTIKDQLRGGISGFLLVPPLSDSLDLRNLLKDRGVPTVTMGPQLICERISSVMIGHRRIGFITGNPKYLASEARKSGYRDALDAAGIEWCPELVATGRFSYRSGLDAANRLLTLPEIPTAISASNDEMAAAVIAVAHRRHIDVPGDLTVTGFDDTLLATMVWPQITTIRQPISDMSRAAMDLLTRSIRASRAGLDTKCEHLTLDYSLIERESSAPPARRVPRDRIG